MSGYGVSIFAICLFCGVASILSYGSGIAERVAVGIITLYVIISPLSGYVKEFDLQAWLTSLKSGETEALPDYSEVVEDAFCEGLVSAVSTEFSIDADDIRIRLYGFEPEKMRAERIRVILSGRAALSDYKSIERYVDSLGLGECDVEIEIG